MSVRDITERAGANVAAVNYHFGSREGLVEQVIARYINPVNEERVARLDALERKAGGKPVVIEEILDAFVRPFATQVRKSELSEKMFYKLMGRICGDGHDQIPAAVLQGFETVLSRFGRAFGKALKGIDGEELIWRMHFTVGAMVHMMAHGETLHQVSHGASGTPSMEQTISRMIRFAAAGLREGLGADATQEPKREGPQSEFLF